MSAIVFLGPTLTHDAARKVLDAKYLPPAAMGDVLAAARRKPTVIGIVDGYFEHVPAVWHKEILWALSSGVHVFGASSMGALRAVELSAFGMVGVGRIFEAFRDGTLEDDDEVALTHASESDGFRPTSEALVNIRATLQGAEDASIVSAETAAALRKFAKATFYADRSYPALVRRARLAGLPALEIEGLTAFMRERAVDQKRIDALALLDQVRVRLGDPTPFRPRFHFAHTEAWDHVFNDTQVSSSDILAEVSSAEA
ncbi:MAG TPA: TfuA-like protein [Polyangiaceae bacterium]|nr:TfuA-like protein [Polyangiaceae bacterium]